MSSPRFPHGNAHAEKAVGKCHDIKLGLLLMKTTPVSNQHHHFQAPVNAFFGCVLKANFPIYCPNSNNVTCTLDAKNSAKIEISDSSSKFQADQDVWVKVDPNTKWMAGKISQILPKQSYMIELSDGCFSKESAPILQNSRVVLNPA